jgi:hypothetical protein
MLIGRTEALRAYRESSQRFYQENSDVVHAWRWVAACNGRTCAVCWAMHGSVHTVDEQFVSHPGCRCTQVPVTDLSPGLATGPARFANLDTETQRRILGPKKFDAYQSGQISLKSLAGMKDNGRWGMTRHERNLADAIAAHRAGTALPIGPMRHRAGAEPPKPPDEPLEVLLPIVEKQLPAATAAEARQRVVGVTEQYAGMLGSIDDELSQIRKVTNWQYAPETKQRAGELIKLRKEVLSARNERTLDVLSVERPANFTANLKTRDKERKALWTKGVESFKRLVGVELEGKTVNLVSIGRRRAHYDLLGTVKLSSDSPLHTVVHELGHWLEDMSPDVHRKTIDFLQRRTAGESTVGLRAFTGQCYARNERAWRDRFMDPYVGKEYRLPFARTQGVDIYRELYATEVVSMGLQWYIEKPAEFAEKDPDFFDFIFNLVRGR